MKQITLTEEQCNTIDPKHIAIVTADTEGDTISASGVDMLEYASAEQPGSWTLHAAIGWYMDTYDTRGNGTEIIALYDGELCNILLLFKPI